MNEVLKESGRLASISLLKMYSMFTLYFKHLVITLNYIFFNLES